MPSSIPGSAMTESLSMAERDARAESRADDLFNRAAKPSGPLRDLVRRLRKNPGAMAGAFVLAAIVLLCVLAPVIAPYDPIEQDSQAIRAHPSRTHYFGADNFGRDVYSRVLYGRRKSLPVGLVAVAIGAAIGVTAGLAAG